MKKRLSLFLLFSIATIIANAQLFDNYGINLGTSYSNQSWRFGEDNNSNLILPSYTQKKDYILGLTFFLSFEKKINKVISFKPEIGFIQKGFKTDFKNLDTSSSNTKGIVRLTDLGLNFRFIIKPIQLTWSPYLYLGNRFAYRVSANYIKNTYDYKDIVNEFNKPCPAVIIGLGVVRNDLLYIELEYNRGFYRTDLPGTYNDNIWSFKLGVNINKI